MKKLKKIVGRRDYWTLDIHYGQYQGKRRDDDDDDDDDDETVEEHI